MSTLRIGGLFAGYGGLELAIRQVFPQAEPAWFSEFGKAQSAILAHHWPTVPNLGDITAIDWASVDPVDIVTGGSPCQDMSPAGRRAGMRAGTRSGLWSCMRAGIEALRPRLVVWENVRGALSACASSASDSVLGPCPRCVGVGPGHAPHLRAVGRVVGDLAGLGYDACWVGLRAADVGAPHGRFRVFVVAWPSEDPAALLPTPAVNDMGRAYTPDEWDAWTERMRAEHRNGNGHGASLSVEALRLLPTPISSDAKGARSHGDGGPDLRTALDALLPTPRATRGGSATETSALLPTPTAKDSAASGGATGSSNVTLTDAAVRGRGLMPTPTTAPTTGNGHARNLGAEAGRFGQYAAAIARWEAVLGRSAPNPTEPTGKAGAHRLSPRFVEWMMGLPAGWVTDAPGVTRNAALEALGNGVVPQQGAEGIAWCLAQARAVLAGDVAA